MAVTMALASFLTGLFLWGIGVAIVMAGSYKTFPPFSYVWIFVGVFVCLGLFFPNFAVNLIGRIWKDLADVLSKSNRTPW